MTQEHPVHPSRNLIQQWLSDYFGCTVSGELSDSELYLATQAARWGADQELEACCEYISRWFATPEYRAAELRAARRPKPLSLKEQALEALDRMDQLPTAEDQHIIRRALEALPD